MPVVRIFVDEPHWETVRENVSSLGGEIQKVLTERLKAAPESCQILFSQALMPQLSPSIYVDFQYRANAERTKETVQPAADLITKLLSGTLKASCRTRAFAIDIDTLNAAEAR